MGERSHRMGIDQRVRDQPMNGVRLHKRFCPQNFVVDDPLERRLERARAVQTAAGMRVVRAHRSPVNGGEASAQDLTK